MMKAQEHFQLSVTLFIDECLRERLSELESWGLTSLMVYKKRGITLIPVHYLHIHSVITPESPRSTDGPTSISQAMNVIENGIQGKVSCGIFQCYLPEFAC